MYFEALASGGDDWYNIVLITAPEGASITFDDGDEEITVTGTGMQYPVPLHNDSSTYSITVDANGFVQTDSVTTSAVSGTVFTKKISYAKIRLTFDDAFRGQNFNITDGSISPSTPQAFPSTGNTIDLYVPNTGTWKTSSSAAGESYESKGVTVVDLDSSYLDELHTRPDGKTVTPTDNIQTWLECAGIRNKDYTTLEEVLADKETLQTLISDENAVDYMVRSKSWITSKGLVPIMTSMTTPKGEVIESGHYSTQIGYLAFDGNDTTGWSNTNGVPQGWLGYTFTSPQIVKFVSFKATRIATFTIQGSNDGFVSDTHELTSVISTGATGDTAFTYDVDLSSNTTAYESYRINILTTTQYEPKIHTLQFYSRTDDGITDDSTAMRYIGLRNYASDTLLDDADWCEAIASSTYRTSVLNVEVPIMTSDTAPSGYEAFSSTLEQSHAYYAFNTTTANGATNSRIATPPIYVGIKFPTTKRIYATLLTLETMGNTGDLSAVQIELQYSSDGNTWSTFKQYSVAITNNSKDDYLILGDSGNKYQYYRFYSDKLLYTGNTNSRNKSIRLQFYGREDVDESVIHIYSAASDNDIHYLSGSTPVTVASTDTDGHGTIARTLLPAGTYDLYSSVAMDPDGDLSTEYFHKEVTVKSDTIEIILMPDNALYWCGYNPDMMEQGSTANGWHSNYAGTNPPTFNTNDAVIGTASIAWGTKNPITGNIKALVIGIADSGGSTPNYGYACATPSKGQYAPNGFTTLLKSAGYDSLKLININNVSNSYYIHWGASRSHSIKAIWYDSPNPLANFFSAANDQVYYISSGVHVPVAKTDIFGEAVVDLSSIPTGAELYSSVAMDPDGDMSTQYYHKTFTLDADGKFRLMPENALYWFGYISDNTESVLTSNGWGLGATPLTYDINYARLNRSSRSSGGIGTSKPVTGVTKIHHIMRVTDSNRGYRNAGVNMDATKTKYSSTASYYQQLSSYLEDTNWHYEQFTPNITDGYVSIWDDTGQKTDWAAFWYDTV